jgi:hypothetical protein
MSELERRLAALGSEIVFPPEPDVAAAVVARLEERPRRPFPWRTVAIAVAVLAAVAVATAFAVPQARTTILRWFHLRGAAVERVETLPRGVERSQAGGLGRPYSLAGAERIVGFHLALPPFEGGKPNRVYVLNGALASVIVRTRDRSVLLSEYRSVGPEFLRKSVSAETNVEPVQVDGERGLWVEGATHALIYPGGFSEPRTILIHRNVLLWVHHDLTLRLEGKLSKAEALRLARATR